MNRKISVEELKEDVDAVIRQVTAGDHVTVYDNGQPIASIQPAAVVEAKHPSEPRQRLGDYRPRPLPGPIDFDPLEFLIQDREKERRR
jgi:antitoxin (DNA-binding transcriptional repressor) of toxin-antitoxin stability system